MEGWYQAFLFSCLKSHPIKLHFWEVRLSLYRNLLRRPEHCWENSRSFRHTESLRVNIVFQGFWPTCLYLNTMSSPTWRPRNPGACWYPKNCVYILSRAVVQHLNSAVCYRHTANTKETLEWLNGGTLRFQSVFKYTHSMSNRTRVGSHPQTIENGHVPKITDTLLPITYIVHRLMTLAVIVLRYSNNVLKKE